MHFLDRQSLAKRRTLWLLAVYLLTVTGVVYLSYSLVQALLLLRSSTVEPPKNTLLYLLHSPFDFHAPHNNTLLLSIAGVVVLILGVSAIVSTWQLRNGGLSIVRMLNAECVVPNKSGRYNRILYNVVEEMAISSGVRVPHVFVLRNETGINAFSAGWGINDAVICVTQGMIDQFSRDELQAVIAHEFSHILNGDTRLNFRLLGLLLSSHVLIFLSWGACSTILGIVGFTMFMIASAGRYTARDILVADSALSSILSSDNVPFVFSLITGISVICFLNFVFNTFLKYAITRQREYLADAAAVQWTRYPPALISALQKIEKNTTGSRIFHSRASIVSHMTFASVQFQQSWWLDTHPPVGARIRCIESRKEFWPEQKQSKKQKNVQPKAKTHSQPGAKKITAKDWSASGTVQEVPTNLASVSDLIRAIPEEISMLALNPNTVATLVFALLLDHNNEIRQKQLALIGKLGDAAMLERTKDLTQKTDALAERLRPTLSEIAFPALRLLTPDHYRQFRATVNAMMRADGKIDLFEYTFNALLIRDLDMHFRLTKTCRVQYFSCQAVLEPFVVVLSMVAYAGNRGDGMMMRSYQEGIEVFGMRQPILSSKDCGFAQFDAALWKLAAASDGVKRRVLSAITACIMADNFVTIRERELLRVISAMLGVPMPPLA